MRNRTVHTPCSNRAARGGSHLVSLALGLSLLAPVTGCGPGQAEMFISDVKNFYLSGVLTSSGLTAEEPSSSEGVDALTVSEERLASEASSEVVFEEDDRASAPSRAEAAPGEEALPGRPGRAGK